MSKLDKQTAKLISRIAENLPEMDGDTMQGWINKPKRLQEFLRGLCHQEVVLDTIIRVDRSIRPVYPDWVKTVMHLELENTGPAEYDISAVEQWLHDSQKGGKWLKGNLIYSHLTETKELEICLGLRDLEEIKKKGIAFFRKHFKGKAVFGWKSVVRRSDDSLGVPYLCGYGGKVVLRWYWLDYGRSDSYPALRFAM